MLLFILTYHSGLRISEAVSFNYELVQKNSFYLVKSKGKTRSVYISKSVISELKKQAWEPNFHTRFGFYKFLRKVRKEMGVSLEIELSPHTLRRCWTTYQAQKGVPLPVLQKALGHSSVRTTALYWKSEEEVSQVVIREWLERSPDYLLAKWLERKVLVFENQVEKEEIYKQTIQVLTDQNQKLTRKVRKLEGQLEKKREKVEEDNQKVKTEIELKPMKIYG